LAEVVGAELDAVEKRKSEKMATYVGAKKVMGARSERACDFGEDHEVWEM